MCKCMHGLNRMEKRKVREFLCSFDLIGIIQTSGIGGQGLKVGNFADMEIEGLEFSINSLNYEGKGFSWRSNINMGYS